MPLLLADRVALVTGSSGGLGEATARTLAREGAKVCVNYNKSASSALRVVEEIEKHGGRASAFKSDVANEKEVTEMVSAAIKEFGRIDILINNAGLFYPADTLSIKDDRLDEMWDVHVRGTLNCTRKVVKNMMQNRYGRIVNITSIAAVGTATQETTQYAPTKAAVMLITKRCALEFGAFGITANCIAPGFIRTPINEAGTSPEEYAKTMETIGRKTMLGRIGLPDEIAKAVLFFSSDESKFITGQMLTIDGGRIDNLTHSL